MREEVEPNGGEDGEERRLGRVDGEAEGGGSRRASECSELSKGCSFIDSKD